MTNTYNVGAKKWPKVVCAQNIFKRKRAKPILQTTVREKIKIILLHIVKTLDSRLLARTVYGLDEASIWGWDYDFIFLHRRSCAAAEQKVTSCLLAKSLKCGFCTNRPLATCNKNIPSLLRLQMLPPILVVLRNKELVPFRFRASDSNFGSSFPRLPCLILIGRHLDDRGSRFGSLARSQTGSSF
jgi:hypothetical protein